MYLEILLVLFIAFVIHLLFIDTGESDRYLFNDILNLTSNKRYVKDPQLTPMDRPGTNWYNEWLMERKLNE